MKIVSAASAFPRHYCRQEALLSALQQYWGDRLENPQLLSRLHSRARVDGRHLALPMIEYYGLDTWGDANRAWFKAAEELGALALCRALAWAGLEKARLGFADLHVGDRRFESVRRRPADQPHGTAARHTPRAGFWTRLCRWRRRHRPRRRLRPRSSRPDRGAGERRNLLVDVAARRHLGSQSDLLQPIWGRCSVGTRGGADVEMPGVEIVATRSTFYPGTEDIMGWDISENGFRIVLSPRVPDVIRENLGRDVDALLGEHGLERHDIASWIMHTGGPKILEATQEAPGVDETTLAASWECLRRVGNLSSASVLIVLENYLTRRRPEPGSWSVLGAMGPGFCSELVLLRW